MKLARATKANIRMPHGYAPLFFVAAAARPSCFYELGRGLSDKRAHHPLHSAKFEAGERGVETGVELHIAGALALLDKK